MENFESKLKLYQKTWLNNIGGIFDNENIKDKIKELEQIFFYKKISGVVKNLVKKTVKQKKFFEDILNSYTKSLKDFNNLKDLSHLASQEKDDDTIHDCEKKFQKY